MVEKALQDMTYSTNPYKASAEDLANLYHNILWGLIMDMTQVYISEFVGTAIFNGF